MTQGDGKPILFGANSFHCLLHPIAIYLSEPAAVECYAHGPASTKP